MSNRTVNPYGHHAHDYIDKGWPYPIPLGCAGRRAEKKPPPGDVTGWSRPNPTPEQIEGWVKTHAVNNIGLRMPDGVIGIDVDDYDAKHGAEQLVELEKELGKLPPAPRSTSRGADSPSGIRFFSVPPGTHVSGKVAKDIEAIQSGHRYACVWPSEHEETHETYRWLSRDGEPIDIPRVDKLRPLPERWLAYLADKMTKPGSKLAGIDPSDCAELSSAQVEAWLGEYGGGQMCRAVRWTMRHAVAALDDDEGTREASHYDTARDAVYALVQFAVEGHLGARTALRQVGEAYGEYIATKTNRDATEWQRMVGGAVSKAAAIIESDWSQHPDRQCPDREGFSDESGFAFRWHTAAEIAAPTPSIDWLVRSVLERGGYGPLAGAKKTLKSHTVDDLTLSVASRRPFLGYFEVPSPGPVLVFVSEGGRIPYMRRRRRLAEAMDMDDDELACLPIEVTFDVRDIDSSAFRDELARKLDKTQPVLVVIDSLYGFHPADIDAGNVYDRGAMLTRLSSLLGGQAALVVCDHFNKSGSALDLDSIAQAGMGPWAHTWALQRHRSSPRPDEGRFALETVFAGREWGGRRWHIDWNVGSTDPETGLFVGDISRTVRSADWSDAENGADGERRAAALRIIDDAGDFVLTETSLITAIGGNKSAARKAVRDLRADRTLIVARHHPAKEGNREVKRDRIGRGEWARPEFDIELPGPGDGPGSATGTAK